MSTFLELGVQKQYLAALKELGIKNPTEIQEGVRQSCVCLSMMFEFGLFELVKTVYSSGRDINLKLWRKHGRNYRVRDIVHYNIPIHGHMVGKPHEVLFLSWLGGFLPDLPAAGLLVH